MKDNKIIISIFSAQLAYFAYGTGPDLVATNAYFSSPAVVGQSATVYCTVKNLGTATSVYGAWTDRIYLSTDSVLDGNDLGIGQWSTGDYGYVVGTGEVYSWSKNVVIPSTNRGPWFLIVRTYNHDSGPNPGSNTSAFPVTLLAPDLVPTDVHVVGPALRGGKMEISWTVQNQGDGAVQSGYSWSDGLYLSTDAVWDASDTELGRMVDPLWGPYVHWIGRGGAVGSRRKLHMLVNRV